MEKLATGSALPRTPIAILCDTLQEIIRDEKRTYGQMKHMEAEFYELATLQDNNERMAHVLGTAAGEFGPLRPPRRGDFAPDCAPKANSKSETACEASLLWEPPGVSRSIGEWVT